MSGFQHYMQQRQTTQIHLQRQELVDRSKLSVPIAKLEHDESRAPRAGSSDCIVACTDSIPQDLRHLLGLRSDPDLTDRGVGFDTDVEDLDETTSLGSACGSNLFKGIMPSLRRHTNNPVGGFRFENRVQSPSRSSIEQLGYNQESNHIQTEDAMFEVGTESAEDNEEDDEDLEPTKEVARGPKSPEDSQIRRKAALPSRESVLAKLTKTPTDLAKNFGRQRSCNSSPFPRLMHNVKVNAANSSMTSQHEHQSRIVDHTISSKVRHTSDGTVNLIAISNPSTFFQGTLPLDPEDLHKPSVVSILPHSSQPQSPKPQPTELSRNDVTEVHDFTDHVTPVPICSTPTAESGKLRRCINNITQFDASGDASLYSAGWIGQQDKENFNGEHAYIGKSYESGYAMSDGNTKCQKQSRELDYSGARLANMKFHQLSDEPFHIDPQSLGEAVPSDVTGSTLTRSLVYLLELEDQNTRTPQQGAFFKSLPIAEYEECGDIIVEKFSNMIQRFKNIRQERRKVAKDFENEVARREESVRRKINVFNADFDRLKRSGEEIVRKGPAS